MSENQYIAIRKSIGAQFKKHRLRKKLSYRQLDAITGIDYSWISKFEKGQVNFEIDSLIKLCSGLKIQLGELMDFKHGYVDE
ncbi:helix-turn-helix domain-containing protein [Flavihumibacter rivuli]|uniref:helix-turn-helix domain-containing protein n=1 Tax=Flavihumibacter rivuli TaxID=2838156 RepID=UPI001BDF59E4|nr:helix-turn-helix transcriptional regulator [Flavihumibacter rivuli]ULQ55451.1 helix-turn-helix domain-containing protein [Flavihumibacter rivuli]